MLTGECFDIWVFNFMAFMSKVVLSFIRKLLPFEKGGPLAIVTGLAKSGFTAAFTLIFISEIGDKTFFIAALLAMQYDKMMVLCGSMGALSLMTILSVVIGRIFKSVPAQFQTTLPVGEYAAVALLAFFEWGDRSMLATIALGAAQSSWGVACGAIAGHLFATSLAILGGAFLAKYISGKLIGYIQIWSTVLVFAAATLFRFF
ncbi:hypothetical protein HPP92_008897 [Vanilla planifolia]|uniref:GDT1 family protein n=1 Tax=Vanilla planifolia TaxID=51239 RepID=A0A835RE74_VANPL|nr:hypothetical protein HPP92_008897 [Vanilla planifolia]